MKNLISYIQSREKRTPVKVYLWEKEAVAFPGCREFTGLGCKLVLGPWETIQPILEENREKIADLFMECDRRNSALELMQLQDIPARIEPGAILREQVTIGENAVIMMGAVLNVGASVGRETMIDMNAVLGARAAVGSRCHIGAGAVLAGVLEPPSATPVIVEDDVMVGANAVILEGCRIGKGAVIAAGSVVTGDIPAGMVAAGCPAKIIKEKDERTKRKTALTDGLR